MLRAATHADIPRLMEIRASVGENRLSDPNRVTLADYNWFIDHAAIHVWEEEDCIQGLSAGDPRDGSIWRCLCTQNSKAAASGKLLFRLRAGLWSKQGITSQV